MTAPTEETATNVLHYGLTVRWGEHRDGEVTVGTTTQRVRYYCRRHRGYAARRGVDASRPRRGEAPEDDATNRSPAARGNLEDRKVY